MNIFRKLNLVKIFILISLLFPTVSSVMAQDQVIDSAGFSVTTQLPEKSPVVSEGELYTVINDNIPYFTDKDLTDSDPWIEFSLLDEYRRVGAANAVLTSDLMPTQVRENVSNIQPSGWQQVKYNNQYLYNRSHLIGFQLIGDGNPELNLMTGTREFNADGMIPFENFVAMTIESGLTVRYRVTPFYEAGNVLASGVFMEGFSLEDNGESLEFNIYIPNRQSGIAIDYGTGLSIEGSEITQTVTGNSAYKPTETTLYYSYNRDGSLNADEPTATQSLVSEPQTVEEPPVAATYIVNTNTGKFHYADCSSVNDMAEHNKMPMNDYDQIISMGYVPCKRCNPR
ncbi:DNA/RNA non-specific endonuclease [Fundicoccus culcitae]|uniref:DNA/RNA non-specific endonuclease n=1 Tax=Fundicoccus culcitae TaxID=2969821 RepID=A0ABY5P7V0_9LACT|nr:DNA/RNA non-specific endonuclease [Fundicoccus culcitae]UUX34468.1 DNA/RNA non-specific endonuclease [Fundicoccus culcitae]